MSIVSLWIWHQNEMIEIKGEWLINILHLMLMADADGSSSIHLNDLFIHYETSTKYCPHNITAAVKKKTYYKLWFVSRLLLSADIITASSTVSGIIVSTKSMCTKINKVCLNFIIHSDIWLVMDGFIYKGNDSKEIKLSMKESWNYAFTFQKTNNGQQVMLKYFLVIDVQQQFVSDWLAAFNRKYFFIGGEIEHVFRY